MTTNLGSFRRVGTGYTGKLKTLAFSADIDSSTAPSTAPIASTSRVSR